MKSPRGEFFGRIFIIFLETDRKLFATPAIFIRISIVEFDSRLRSSDLLVGGNSMNSRNCGVLILLVALLADWQNTAQADTLDLQTAAQDHPNLIHQWTQ